MIPRETTARWVWASGIMVLTAGVLAAADPVDQGTGRQQAPPSRPEKLEQFRKLSAADRLRLVENLPPTAQPFQRVTRGVVALNLVGRGALASAAVSEVVCRLKPRTKDGLVSTIQWVVDEGALVKKGDRLVVLDNAALRDQRAQQQIVLAQAEAARVQAEENLTLVKKESQIDLRLAEVTLRLAELGLKKQAGDADQKQLAELKVEKAKLLLERGRAQARAREVRAETDLRLKRAVLEQEAVRLREIEQQIEQCVLTAPRDGVVVYRAGEPGRGGAALLAEGEPVREGQKLLHVCDVTRLVVVTRIPEAVIAQVREGQSAAVRVDAFPDRVLPAKVTQVSPRASQQDWLRSDVKVYPVQLALAGELPGLKPGMSAEVRIKGEERPNLLRVPVQAVMTVGRQRFCFVKTADGLAERPVVPGLHGNQFVEIKEGLKEGDLILRDPPALMDRLDLGPTEGRKPPADADK